MRPELTKSIAIHDFKNFYWLKEELQQFCRSHSMSASGSKIEIAERIEAFLLTGEKKKPRKKSNVRKIAPKQAELSLDTVIAENHRCSQEVRTFFKSIIPKFHFSTTIQNYFKNNIGHTYRDVITAWYEEQERKKAPSYKKELAPQFEYNQFTCDFFADPNNKGKSREDAIEAWNTIKKLSGSNRYVPKD